MRKGSTTKMLKRNKQAGFGHIIMLAVIAIVAVGVVGMFVVVKSHASTCTSGQYSNGSGGNCVRDIQQLVNWHNKYNHAGGAQLTVDGGFGPKTKAAVQAVQRHYGISADGIVGPQTWGVICHPQTTLQSGTFPYGVASNAGCSNRVAPPKKSTGGEPKPAPTPAPGSNKKGLL